MEAPVYLFEMMADVVNGVNLFFAQNPTPTPGILTSSPGQPVSVMPMKTAKVTVLNWTDKTTLPTLDGTYQISGFDPVKYVALGNLIVRNGDILICKNGICRLGNSCFYMFAHPLEIAQTLTELSKSEATANRRYPLIAVVADVKVSRDSTDYYGKTKLTCLIATITDPTLKADEREAINFQPTLLPLYYQFLDQIRASKHFYVNYDRGILHEYTKRMFWGRNGLFSNVEWGKLGGYTNVGNIFNDFIDAIEIDNLQLTIKNPLNNKTT